MVSHDSLNVLANTPSKSPMLYPGEMPRPGVRPTSSLRLNDSLMPSSGPINPHSAGIISPGGSAADLDGSGVLGPPADGAAVTAAAAAAGENKAAIERKDSNAV